MKIYLIFSMKYLKKKILKEIVQKIVMVKDIKELVFQKKNYVVLMLNITEVAMINAHQEQKY